MNQLETARIKTAAGSMKFGKALSLGIDRGPSWSVDDVLEHLGIAKPEAA